MFVTRRGVFEDILFKGLQNFSTYIWHIVVNLVHYNFIYKFSLCRTNFSLAKCMYKYFYSELAECNYSNFGTKKCSVRGKRDVVWGIRVAGGRGPWVGGWGKIKRRRAKNPSCHRSILVGMTVDYKRSQ